MATGGPSSLQTDAIGVPDPQHVKGYPLEIFEKKADQDKFSCGFCSRILRDPVQAHCGHRYCQHCQERIKELSDGGSKQLCKSCKDEGMSDEESTLEPQEWFPDRGINREMMNIKTKCPNDVCDWTGLFKQYGKHEAECKYKPMICEKCGEGVSKQKMEHHKSKECSQRIIKCEHCRAEMPYAQKQHHFKECQKYPQACSQCNKHIPRDRMKKHQTQDCPNRMITCPIDGCEGPLQQGRFQQHVQKDQPRHLAWILGRIKDIDDSIAALITPGSGGAAVAAAATTDKGPGGWQRAMDEMNKKMERLQLSLDAGGAVGGAGRGSGEDGAQATATTAAASTGGGSVERINAMEFKVNSLEPILSVLHGEMNRCIGAIEALETKLRQETVMATEYQDKIKRFDSTMTSMTATLSQNETKLRDMEGRLLNMSQDRPDGTLLWKIPNFSKARQDAIAGTVTNIHSRPFYTGPLGYKMSVRLYPNGDGIGKNTHLSLFFTIMRSHHDALLPWPFNHKVYFMLIDQNFQQHMVDAFRSEPSSSSFQRPTSAMNVATGCPMFMQINKLNAPGRAYLKDDTLYIRVVVDTEGLDTHLKQFDPRHVAISSSS